MFGGMNLDKFYYKTFDNGENEILTGTSFNLEDLR